MALTVSVRSVDQSPSIVPIPVRPGATVWEEMPPAEPRPYWASAGEPAKLRMQLLPV
jgi:hypothetical protein